MYLSHGAVGLFAVCDCVTCWSFPLYYNQIYQLFSVSFFDTSRLAVNLVNYCTIIIAIADLF